MTINKPSSAGRGRYFTTGFLRTWSPWSVPLSLALLLSMISINNMLLFHTLAELFAISVAIILSIVAWHTYRFSHNHFLMFLGVGYFWVGILDLLHTLTFKGMHIFTATSANTSIQFWTATRYLEAILLLTAPFFLDRPLKRAGALAGFGLISLLIYSAIMSGHFPDAYLEGNGGLTRFKIISEYAIIALLFMAVLFLSRRKTAIGSNIYRLMVLSILFTIAAELCFTLYINVYSAFIVAGHLFKFFSYWLIFIAVVRTSLTEPFEVLSRASSTYDAVPNPIIVVDRHGAIRQANKAACYKTDLDADQLLDRNCHAFFHDSKIPATECVVCQHIAGRHELHNFEMFNSNTGSWNEFTLSPFKFPGAAKGIVHVSTDITARKRIEYELLHQANFDTLTQMPNRALATDRLQQAIQHARRKSDCIAVLFIDIDNFKNVNDSLGHGIGDKLLVEVARGLQQCVSDTDTVARWGGDEFVIILPDLSSLIDAEIHADRILAFLATPLLVGQREFIMSASIGISGYPDDGTTVDQLLSNADAAMYQAKDAGKNTCKFFTADMNHKVAIRMEMQSHLHHAIEKKEFHLVYQPQVDIRSGKVVGAEALLRWKNPRFGDVLPQDFIPLTEESGLIQIIGEWVLHTACKDLDRLAHLHDGSFRMSVNISPRQTKKTEFIDCVAHVFAQNRLAQQRLTLEITESLLLQDDNETQALLYKLKDLGIHLSLDDFGTGYSSVNYLKRFPFDEIKIDRSFVRDIHVDPGNAALCRAMIAMAQSMNLAVVAEGVETREQLDFLRNNGAHIVQGYLTGPAMPFSELLTYLTKQEIE